MCAGRIQRNVENSGMQLWSCYVGNALNSLATSELLSFFHCGIEKRIGISGFGNGGLGFTPVWCCVRIVFP